MDKIPLINPKLIKVTSSSNEKKPAPILPAVVASSTRMEESPTAEYKVVLKIDQKMIETVSPHNLTKGSELYVKVLPGPELKIISTGPNSPLASNTSPLPASNTIQPQLIQQLLADRVPQTQQQDFSVLIKQLSKLLQSTEPSPASTSANKSSGLSPNTESPQLIGAAKPIGAKPSNHQATANQTYQQHQHLLKPLSTTNTASQASTFTPTSTQTPTISSANNPLPAQVQNTQQQVKNWLIQLPSSIDVSTGIGLKNALNNTGTQAEAQLKQLATQTLQLNSKSANSIFKQLQELQQPSYRPSPDSSDNNINKALPPKKSPNNNSSPLGSNTDLTSILKKTAKVLSDSSQQVLLGILKNNTLPQTANQPNQVQPGPITPSLIQTGPNWQNPLLTNPSHTSLESLLLDPLLQNPSSNNKFALSQILNFQGIHHSTENKEFSASIPLNWPERSSSDAQLLRNIQNLLGHIEKEQIQQRSMSDDNSFANTLQQNSQWLPLLINHNHQLQLIEFYIEQKEKQNTKGEKKQSWSINLHFELPKLGPLGIEISMLENECKALFWSESSSTLSQINKNIQPLRQRLTEQGILVEDIQSRHGNLPKSQNNIQQRIVDIKT